MEQINSVRFQSLNVRVSNRRQQRVIKKIGAWVADIVVTTAMVAIAGFFIWSAVLW